MSYFSRIFIFRVSFLAILITSSSSLSHSQPFVATVKFSEAIREVKEVKARIEDSEIKLAQINKTAQIKSELDRSVESLRTLEDASKARKLSNDSLLMINENIKIVAAIGSQENLSLQDTEDLEIALAKIQAQAIVTNCADNQMVNVDFSTTRDGIEIRDEYVVYYRAAVERSKNGQRFGGGKPAPVSGQLISSIYFFWAQDSAGRKGPEVREPVCGSQFSVRLMAPQQT